LIKKGTELTTKRRQRQRERSRKPS